MDEERHDFLATSAFSCEQHIGIASGDSIGVPQHAAHCRALGHNAPHASGGIISSAVSVWMPTASRTAVSSSSRSTGFDR